MKNRQLIIIPLVLLIGILTGCNKEQVINDQQAASSQKTVQDEIIIEDLMEDLFLEIEESDYWLNGFKEGRPNVGCRTITVEPEERGVFPKTITIDYGQGCEVKEGVVKKGKIIIEISAAPNSDEWQKTIRFARYAVNDKLFEGGKRITFLRNGRRGYPTWSIQSRIKIHWGEESFIQQNMDRTRFQTAGTETPRRPMDNKFLTVGTTTGINREGKGYKTTITEPLHFSKDCKWIKKGIIEFKIRGESDVTLDFGDGFCDNLATFTKDGVSKEIKLKR